MNERRQNSWRAVRTIAVVAAVCAVAIVTVPRWRQQRNRRKVVRWQLYSFQKMLEHFVHEHGAPPSEHQGIDVLWPYNKSSSNRHLQQDPWGTPYQYIAHGTNYEFRSAGPDRRTGTKDDIISRGESNQSVDGTR